MKFVRRVLLVLLALGVLGGIAAAGTAYYFYQLISADLPSLETLEDYSPPLASVVYDRHGKRIGEFFDERRQITPVDQIPKQVIQAFVAAEDDTFFRHTGIDWVSIVRAAWVNFSAGGKIKQGASTITQQVAKSLVGNERSYVRKLKDMLLAKRIEERFTKDEILFLYLNQIYFGHGAYGVGEAARSYFGKPVSELDVSEAALIAGLPKAPSDYSPTVNPEAAEQRRLYVLGRMRDQGFIDSEAYEKAVASRPVLRDPPEFADYAVAAGFTEEVRRTLYRELGSARVLRGGLRIETTLDSDLQFAALLSVQRGLEIYQQRHGGWRGPERHVRITEIEATAQDLARENHLQPLAPGQAPPPPPVNQSLLGVVREVGPKKARVALAPEIEIEVGLEEATWAFRNPGWRDDGKDSRGLDQLLHAGDVAHFILRPPPLPILPPPAVEEAASPDAAAGSQAVPVSTASAALNAAPTPVGRPDPKAGLRWELHQVPSVEGGLLSLDVATGDVLAMVGGYDYTRSEFNRVTQARRQPGSAFKPFLYGTSFEWGYSPSSIVLDSPVSLIDPGSGLLWAPKNYKNIFGGAVPMREALARSLNNAAVHVFLDVGVDNVIDYARRLGVRSPLGRHLSLSLGSTEVSLVELVRAYGTFAAGGRLLQPRFIVRVLDRKGTPLLENAVLDELDAPPATQTAAAAGAVPPVAASASGGEDAGFQLPSQGLPADEAFLVTYLLRAPVEHPRGTAKQLKPMGRPLAGKTGTTNEQNDAWFIGFSPQIATGVWVGYDQKKMLGDKETGGRTALPIWLDYMNTALAGLPAADFPVPEGIEFRRVGGVEITSASEDGYEEVIRTTPVSFEPFLTRTTNRRKHVAYENREEGWEDDAPRNSYDLLREEAF